MTQSPFFRFIPSRIDLTFLKAKANSFHAVHHIMNLWLKLLTNSHETFNAKEPYYFDFSCAFAIDQYALLKYCDWDETRNMSQNRV